MELYCDWDISRNSPWIRKKECPKEDEFWGSEKDEILPDTIKVRKYPLPVYLMI